jgi:zinc transporter ZupT
LAARYSAAFALGIFFWFFVDTIQGSANLDVNAGFAGGVDQVAMVLLFVVGIWFFFLADRNVLSQTAGVSEVSFAVPMLAALAVGIHGFGEGTAFGSTASFTSSTSLLDAFGGLSAGAAYALHKMFEPMMVGALYVAYSKDHPNGMSVRIREILTLALIFVIPSLVGATTGYFISYDATYFFALGTGTSIYAAFRLGRQVLQPTGASQSRESLKVSTALIIGFLLIYSAALLHS